MTIVPQSVKLLTSKDAIEQQILTCELAARTCYNSVSAQTGNIENAVKFLKALIDRHHESVLEHSLITFELTTNIGVSREFMRHRHQSPSERSTRYCNYSNSEKYEDGIEFCLGGELLESSGDTVFHRLFNEAERTYNYLTAIGVKPQEARHALPLATKTVIVSSASIREWRHILKMRSAKSAHPDIRELSMMVYAHLCELGLKPLFEDVVAQK